jgi:hypothetical protein
MLARISLLHLDDALLDAAGALKATACTRSTRST